jgi:hypothetical protein
MDRMVQRKISMEYDRAFEADKWFKEIPYLNFPSNWNIRMVPPSTGAVVRFHVSKGGDTWISVYLDCYDILGFMGEPYWEIYPYNGDTFRCPMNETDKLLEAIEYAVNEQLNIMEEPLKIVKTLIDLPAKELPVNVITKPMKFDLSGEFEVESEEDE